MKNYDFEGISINGARNEEEAKAMAREILDEAVTEALHHKNTHGGENPAANETKNHQS